MLFSDRKKSIALGIQKNQINKVGDKSGKKKTKTSVTSGEMKNVTLGAPYPREKSTFGQHFLG